MDFSYLINSHSSSTSHLILKSEQEKYQKSESVLNTSKYFNVDIKILNQSIKSVPFYALHDIKGIEWSQEEINQMNEEATVNDEIYKTLLAENRQISEEIRLMKLSSPAEKETKQQKTDSDDKESMEQWLDDVLDL